MSDISEEDILHAVQNAVFAEGGPKRFSDWAESQTGQRPKLDFSQFHPLDHRITDRRCREFYGGPRRHLWVWWNFKFDYKPNQLWHRWVLCRFGKHKPTRFKRRPSVDAPWEHGHSCRWCHRQLS